MRRFRWPRSSWLAGATGTAARVVVLRSFSLIGPRAARELVAGIPGAEERVLDGTGHLLRFTHPERYARTVDAFLERRATAARAADRHAA